LIHSDSSRITTEARCRIVTPIKGKIELNDEIKIEQDRHSQSGQGQSPILTSFPLAEGRRYIVFLNGWTVHYPTGKPASYRLLADEDDARLTPDQGVVRLLREMETRSSIDQRSKSSPNEMLEPASRGIETGKTRAPENGDPKGEAEGQTLPDKNIQRHKMIIGTWYGGDSMQMELAFRPDSTFQQSFAVEAERPAAKHSQQPVSGTWFLDGNQLTTEVTQSIDEFRIGEKVVRTLKVLDAASMHFVDENGVQGIYHKAKEFGGWKLSPRKASTDVSRLGQIWEEVPVGSKSYEIRADVEVIKSGLLEVDLGGVVYYRPDKNLFYIQCDLLGSSTMTFYGPYEGDPHQLIKLSKENIPDKERGESIESVDKK